MDGDRSERYRSLREGTCHLWHFHPRAGDSTLLKRGIDLLSADELVRYRRFLVPEPAQTFLAARVVLRTLLSTYCLLDSRQWRFEINRWGRPFIANPDAPPDLTFNLSHRRGFIVCLIACGRDIGVDVEDQCSGGTPLLDIAERFFSPSEAAALRRLPASRQLGRFYELWTLKEAYIKARGQGLSLGLAKFSFTVTGETASVCFDPDFEDDPVAWDFRFFRPDAEHLVATAARLVNGLPLAFHMADAAPVVAAALR